MVVFLESDWLKLFDRTGGGGPPQGQVELAQLGLTGVQPLGAASERRSKMIPPFLCGFPLLLRGFQSGFCYPFPRVYKGLPWNLPIKPTSLYPFQVLRGGF